MPIPPSPVVSALMEGEWRQLESQYTELSQRRVTQDGAETFLDAWSTLATWHSDAYSRLFVATTVDTADTQAEARFNHFREHVHPELERLDQAVTQRFLSLGYAPEGMELPTRRLKTSAALFRPENQQLDSELSQLGLRYNQITGARTVSWQGQETTPTGLRPVFQGQDRPQREQAWHLQQERQLEDQEPICQVWREGLQLKRRIARAAGFDGYRAYRWQELHRYDYTPEDSLRLQHAIEEIVVPATGRIYEWRKKRLGVERLRPWDLDVDPYGGAALSPFRDVDQLVERLGRIFDHLCPTLGAYFHELVGAGLLDLENRKNKAPVGYCIRFPESGLPFIFTNAVGVQRDVQTLSHEAGHAFHAFETRPLPWIFQKGVGAEFSEVASMAMEFLVQDLFDHPDVGIYSPTEAAQARLGYLENRLMLWPRVATIDAFQHWVYSHPDDAMDAQACNQQWLTLSERFNPHVDWSDLEPFRATGWQSIPHIHNSPFYYVEYGLALLGAVQIWAHSREDRPGAIERYRHALALGGTRSLPELYEAAGARFTFDGADLQAATDLLMGELEAMWGA